MQKLKISLKLLLTEIPSKLCNKTFINHSQDLLKYPKQQNVSKPHFQNFFNTSKTGSWRFHHYKISDPALKLQLPGFSAVNPVVFSTMKKKLFSSSSSNAAHLKQQIKYNLSCGLRVLSWRVEFPWIHQRISRVLNDPWSGLRWRSWFPSSADKIVVGLVATNVGVYLLWKIADPTFMSKNFMMSVENFASGRVHTLITSAFSHKDEEHLTNNMAGLYLFGTSIGLRFGPQFVVKLYLAGAVVGSIFFLISHMLMAPQSKGGSGTYVDPKQIFGLGASGAVNAIMLLHLFISPRGIYRYSYRYNVFIPVPGLLLGALIIGQDISRMIKRDSNISGEVHLGGAFVAALAWARIKRRRI